MGRSLTALLSLALSGIAVSQQVQYQLVEPRSTLRVPRPVWGADAADVTGNGEAEIVFTDSAGAWFWSPQEPQRGIRAILVQPFPVVFSGEPLAADLNNDGATDVLVRPLPGVDSAPRVLQQIIGSEPTFFLWPLTGVGGTVRGAVLLDVDQDGISELVMSHSTSSGVAQGIQMWRQTITMGGQFTVQTAATPAVMPSDCWLVTGDLDGDGDADVLALPPAASPVLLRWQGAAFVDDSASLPPQLASGYLHGSSGDLDGDGAEDFALVRAGGSVDVVWGSSGALTLQSGLSVPGAMRIEVANLDGDATVDLVAKTAAAVVVVRNQGNRQFAVAESVADADPLMSFGVADANGNGRDDVLAAFGTVFSRLRMLYGANPLAEDVSAEQGFAEGQSWRVFLPRFGDLNGDGRIDALMRNSIGFEVHLAQGRNHYQRSEVITSPPVSGQREILHLLDLDGDGDLDLLIDADVQLHAFHNDGLGNFTAGWTSLAVDRLGIETTRTGDVNGDGTIDLVRAETTGLSCFRNTGGQMQSQVIPLPTGATVPNVIELADLDGDGDLDLATNSVLGASNVLLAGDGQGNFTAASGWNLTLPGPVLNMRAGDADGDGTVDLLLRTQSGQALTLMLNNGLQQFLIAPSWMPQVVTNSFSAGVVFEDLDGDGDRDVLAQVDIVGGDAKVLVNDGTRFINLTASRWMSTNTSTSFVGWRIDTADIDGDGDRDVLLGNDAEQFLLFNHLRQLRVSNIPRIGRVLDIDLFSGPGFSPPGVGLVFAGLAGAATPQLFAGFAGSVDIHPAQATLISLRPLSTLGVSRTFAPLPNLPQLIGAELFLQGLVLSTGAQPSGVTNAVREVVLP